VTDWIYGNRKLIIKRSKGSYQYETNAISQEDNEYCMKRVGIQCKQKKKGKNTLKKGFIPCWEKEQSN